MVDFFETLTKYIIHFVEDIILPKSKGGAGPGRAAEGIGDVMHRAPADPGTEPLMGIQRKIIPKSPKFQQFLQYSMSKHDYAMA